MIKAVIFDFFGVICSDEYWQFVKEDKNMGGKFSKLSHELNLGEMSWEDFVNKIADETGEDVETVERLYTSEKIHPELIAYIDKLHAKYKTALLTNASEEQFAPLVAKAHLDKVFDEIIISSKVGMAKPDPRVFEYALEKLGVKPEEALFIDDLERHVNAAKAVGINTILYRDFPQLKKELESLLNT